MISDDGAMCLSPDLATCNYPLRRQSAIVDFKPKVSKWTRVKAAFKWEKANALPGTIEEKTKQQSLTPVNTEVARLQISATQLHPTKSPNFRYLKVPQASAGVSSGDSVISTSSRDLGLAQSPDYLSSDSSEEALDEGLRPSVPPLPPGIYF